MARSLRRNVSRTEPDDDQFEPDTEETEDEETERPSRGRRELSKPAGRRTRNVEPEDDEDDDEDEPRGHRSSKRRSSRSDEAPRSSLGSGWDAYKENKAKTSKFNTEDQFKVPLSPKEDKALILFLEEKPFATYNEHGVGQGKGYRAYVCLSDDCPFCELGDSPQYRAVFNVVVFDRKGNASVKYWTATPAPLDEIEEQAFDEFNGPLNKPGNYYVAYKKEQTNGFNKFFLNLVTEDQVREVYKFDPLSDDEIDDLAKDTFEAKDVVRVKTRRELREAVQKDDED